MATLKEAEIRPQELFNKYLTLAARDAEVFFSNHDGFLKVACPACGEKKQEPAFNKLGFSYVLCADCGSLYVSPRPPQERFDSFYRDGESVKFWATDFFKHTEAARREKMFRPRALILKELLAKRPDSGGSFIDIGAGYGIFLEEVAALGKFKRVSGIEPGPALAEVCRGKGFEIVMKPVEAVKPAECQADWMTAFEVLEHVFSPVEFLTAAGNLLKPGGSLLLTTLTVSGFDIQTLWEKSKSVFPPHHINLMSTRGLRRLVERAGLLVEDLSTPGELDVDIVANALAEDESLPLSRFVSTLVKSGEATRHDFQEFLKRHALSSHVRVIARKSA